MEVNIYDLRYSPRRFLYLPGHMTYLHNVRRAFAPQKVYLVVGVCNDADTESYKR